MAEELGTELGWITPMEIPVQIFRSECSGNHMHAEMLEDKFKPAERYPLKLVATILRAFANHITRA